MNDKYKKIVMFFFVIIFLVIGFLCFYFFGLGLISGYFNIIGEYCWICFKSFLEVGIV